LTLEAMWPDGSIDMKTAPYIVIIGLLSFIMIDQCNRKPVPPHVITETVIVPGDSVPVPYAVVLPGRDSIVYDIEYMDRPIDTGAILADYFARVYGRDTLANDSSVLVYIDWMVTMNSLIWVKPYIQNRKVTTIINNTTYIYPKPEPREFGLSAGLIGYVSPVSVDIGAGLSVRYRRVSMTYGYGLRGSHMAGLLITLY
jgi:hypothetical protein